MPQQDILGLQITVDDLVLLQQVQRGKHLLGEPTNEFEREAAEGIRLDKLVQVHVQEFRRDAEMPSEVEALREIDHAVLVFRVLNDG